jgi:putative transposase
MAFFDLHSRYVLNWSISDSMDANWCAEALKETIEKYGTPQFIYPGEHA